MQIVKWDGRQEEFDSNKLELSLLRLGAPPKIAESISREIEKDAYSGMTSKDIFDMAVSKLQPYQPAISFREDLKTGLAKMKDGSIFEEYVRLIFQAHGYNVKGNATIQGRCVTHEIDGIIEKNDDCIYLEVKHHSKPHSYTPFDVTLAAKAKWDDMQSGFEKGNTTYCFNRVLVVSNTRLSSHASQYAECVGLDHLGWNIPHGKGLDCMIEEKGLYPITILKNLKKGERDILLEGGILTLRQLDAVKSGLNGISLSRLDELKFQATALLRLGQQVNCISGLHSAPASEGPPD